MTKWVFNDYYGWLELWKFVNGRWIQVSASCGQPPQIAEENMDLEMKPIDDFGPPPWALERAAVVSD